MPHVHRADASGGSDADPTRVSRHHCRVRTQAVAHMHVHDAVAAGAVEADKERAQTEKRKREAVAEAAAAAAAAAGDGEGSARGRVKKKQRVEARRRSVTKNGKKWTVEEDASLLEQRNSGVPPSKIAIPSRTANAIAKRLQSLRKQAATLGDQVDDSITAALGKRQVQLKWTSEEDASLLEQRTRGVPPSKIVIPNRTAVSIYNRLQNLRKQAAALGDNLDKDVVAALAKKQVHVRWTVEEDTSLLELHKRGVPSSKIVIPNRTARSIAHRVQHLRKQTAALDN